MFTKISTRTSTKIVEEKQKLYLNSFSELDRRRYYRVEEKQKLYLNTTSKKVFLKIELVEEKQKLYLNSFLAISFASSKG